MARTPGRGTISTRQEKLANLARREPKAALTTLAHHIDMTWLREAYRRTRKDGAVGVDGVTARLNLRAFIEMWPYEPEDLRDDTGPILVGSTLPRRQVVCDAHSPAGLQSAGLSNTYPLESDGRPVPHARCQPVGARAREAGLRGVRARSARSPDGAGRELAWFPATARSAARRVLTLAYAAWFWG